MSTDFKLYELSDVMNQVAQMIEDGVEGLEDALESIEYSFQDKAESIIKLWRSKLAERDIIKSEIHRLQQRADKLDKDANWLHGYVEREMLNANITEIKSPLFKIALGLNPERVEVLNQSIIPDQYLRSNITIAADKVAIKEAIKNGESVPGCELRQDLKLKIR
jgi:hypothetical protein